MVAVKKSKTSIDDTGTLQSDIASFASSLGLGGMAAESSGFNDSDFRKVGPIKSNSRLPSSTPKNSSGKKFDVKKRETNTFGNRKPAPYRKQETKRSDSVAEVENDRFKNLPQLPLVKASALGAWHKDAAEQEEKLIGKNSSIEYGSVEQWKVLVDQKKELGERLLAQYVKDYWASRGKNGDIKMLVATQRSGTAADKVSALSVLIGDNPVANLRSIDSMLGMVTSKVGKRHAFSAFGSLKEIFIIVLPDRKLKTLFQRPLNRIPENKDGYSLLLFWYWEECLKNRYEQFVSALQGASLDAIVELKSLALKTIFTLLKSKPEQERRLLSSLVNKLGDPENKVASNADYHLANLLAEHPNMKAVVIDEVDNFLFRPHLGMRGKYHAVNFLSQIRLSHNGDGPKAAKRLIDIYFALFKVLIAENEKTPSVEKRDKKGSRSLKEDRLKASSESHVEMDSRLLSVILTGVNRAFPFLHGNEADEVVQAQTPLLFQMVHSNNFNVGVQALMLLDKISSKNQIASDRFYRALYSKLLLPAAMNSSKEEMVIALVLRAMKNDVNIKRVAAFSKRLLQVSLQLPPQYACGFLLLLSEVLKARPPLWNMILQSGTAVEDEDLEHFEDITEDDDKQASPAPKLSENDVNVGTEAGPNDDNDSLPDESGSATSDSESYGLDEDDDLLGNGGLLGHDDIKSSSESEMQNLQDQKPHKVYEPRHREPSYCNADRAGWWELSILASHAHPSVAAMAKTLLSGVNIVYDGNPLTDLSLSAFLDKFMEKKPRQRTWHGASQIEPAKKLDMSHHLIGAEILSLAESDVAPEDVVFHKFYMNKMTSSKKPKKKKPKKTAEDEADEELYAVDGDDDQSDDEEIDNMLDNSNPSLAAAAAGEYDYDDLDNIANEDDEDLIDDGSDQELDAPSDADIAEFDDAEDGIGKDEDGQDDDIAIGDADDGSDLEESSGRRKTKRKSGASPFASLEDYKHLMEDDVLNSESSSQKRKRKSGMEDDDPPNPNLKSSQQKRRRRSRKVKA